MLLAPKKEDFIMLLAPLKKGGWGDQFLSLAVLPNVPPIYPLTA